jgi:hypothetical protein
MIFSIPPEAGLIRLDLAFVPMAFQQLRPDA